MYLCTVVGDYINTIKTTFHLSFDCQEPFFEVELQVYNQREDF